MSLSVTHVSYSNGLGGAGIAASRINSALLKSGFESILGVAENFGNSDESFNISGKSVFHSKIRARSILEISNILYRDLNYHSFNILPSGVHRNLNRLHSDIINLHWINRELLAYYEIRKISKPVFWTLHDMWPLLGSTHIEQFHSSRVYKTKLFTNKIDNFLENRKIQAFSKGIHWIAPSNWMKNKIIARFSDVRKEIPVIPNPIDTEIFKYGTSLEIPELKKLFDDQHPIILFGAAGGISNRIKGFDYLYASYKILLKKYPEVKLALFGQKELPRFLEDDENVFNLGIIRSQSVLTSILNKCSVLALPSVIDNLPQVAVEAISSGTPVVAFNVGGVSDIVEHGINGLTVEFSDVNMFAEALISIIYNSVNLISRKDISARAHLKFSSETIAYKYMQHYRQVIQNA